ncbi:MAG TPA: hypothetical protein VGZ73_25000 [Bryobacteraceae bacterium]|jgi:hypothetical protein|nr:hypothetical protein [Bryobacteraceae bacterium]
MTDPFVGTWKLNPEKSEFGPHHRPTAGTMVFELDEQGHYLMKAEGANAKGEKVVENPQKFIADGETRPLPGFPGLTFMSTRPDPNTIQGEARREDGSIVGKGTFAVSADGKSMTATNSGFDSQLREFQQRTLWERQ